MITFPDTSQIAVTGAARGIGLATAKVLASRGATLELADTNRAGIDAALSSLPSTTDTKHGGVVLDIRNSKDVDSWINGIVTRHGRLDGAANIAGVYRNNVNLVDETDEGYAFHMDVNTMGTFWCMRAQLRAMKAGGSIVNAASVAGQIGAPGLGIYCASKHAVLGLTRSAAKEHPELRINAIAPGLVATPMVQEAEAKQGYAQVLPSAIQRQARPEELAATFAFLLSDDASFVTGATINVDGGLWC